MFAWSVFDGFPVIAAGDELSGDAVGVLLDGDHAEAFFYGFVVGYFLSGVFVDDCVHFLEGYSG